MKALALALLLAAGPALAEDPMSPEEFEAYTTGKTLLYSFEGEEYGGEDYLPGRRVRWSFLDGHCLDGHWYDADDLICFVYEDAPEAPVCWRFYRGPGGLRAELFGGGYEQELYETGEAEEPLFCLGPEVGA
jgi:hypothetical protein